MSEIKLFSKKLIIDTLLELCNPYNLSADDDFKDIKMSQYFKNIDEFDAAYLHAEIMFMIEDNLKQQGYSNQDDDLDDIVQDLMFFSYAGMSFQEFIDTLFNSVLKAYPGIKYESEPIDTSELRNHKTREWTSIIYFFGFWIIVVFFLLFFVAPPAEAIAEFLSIEEWSGIVELFLIFIYLYTPIYLFNHWIPKYYKKRDNEL
jgi:hypothetical protein